MLVLLLLAACASRDGLIDERTRDCSAGQEVSIDLLLNMPKIMSEGSADNLTTVVTIGNNSTQAIEVRAIRVEPGFSAQERYSLENGYREFNKVIEPGDDEELELSVRGQGGRREIDPRWGNDAIEVVLSVYMAGGDIYRCSYDLPAPR